MRRANLVRIAVIVGCFSCLALSMPSRADDTSMTAMMMRESGMRGMLMLDSSSKPLPLVELTEGDKSPPPKYSGIGEVSIPVSADPDVQGYFDQGLRFYFGFNNRESYRAFRYAAEQSVRIGKPCALCYWGEALPLGVDINMAEELEPDRVAANEALATALSHNPDTKTRGLIEALVLRNADCKQAESDAACRKRRNDGYHTKMSELVNQYPDDPNIIVLFADSVLNLTPWQLPSPENYKAARSKLEAAMAKKVNERHDGLRHWYIHLMELSDEPKAAERAADELAPLARAAGHLVHMPSHIYYRIGRLNSAVDTNVDAVIADTKYFLNENLTHPDGDRYKYGYYPHNLHFLIAAAVLSGRSAELNEAVGLLWRAPPPNAEGYRKDKYREVFYLAQANVATPSALRNLRKPEEKEPRASVAYAYTQVMADLWDNKQPDSTMKALDAAVFAYPRIGKDPYGACVKSIKTPGGDTGLCMAAFEYYLAHGRDEGARKQWAAALNAARPTLALQIWMPYDEPPDWLFPTAQTYAGLLIQKAIAQDPHLPQSQEVLREAKDFLCKSLRETSDVLCKGIKPPPSQAATYPGNGWAYYGLWQIAKYLRGDNPKEAEKAFWDHWRDQVTADVPSLKRM
jgi:hypothetical protein